MANTVFQIKRSEVTEIPATLQYGELAYSFLSNKLFIGNTAGSPVVIGGKHYTQIIDDSTSAATASTLVLRDANGNFSANTINAALNGNAATASKLQTPVTISVSDAATGSVSFDGSANVDIALTLKNSGVVANTYGDTLHIPIITVDEKGLITSMNTATISTSFELQADSTGPYTFNSGDTLYVMGGDGISTEVLDSTFTVAVDDTVIRTAPNLIDANATSQSITGGINLAGDLNVTGNVTVAGTTTYINVETLTVTDSLIQLANNNSSDAVSIGVVGKYNDGSAKSTGFFRNVGDKEYYLFNGVTDSLDSVNSINPTANGFSLATINANFSSDIFVTGEQLTYDGSKIVSKANTGFAGTFGSANSYLEITVDNWGQVSNVQSHLISIDTSQVTSGTLTTDRGGIGLATASLLANSVMWYSGTGTSMSQAQATAEGQVLQMTNSGVQFGSLDAGTF